MMTISGAMTVQVSDADAVIVMDGPAANKASFETAAAEVIAQNADVPTSAVETTLSTLSGSSLEIGYSITLKSEDADEASSKIAQSMGTETTSAVEKQLASALEAEGMPMEVTVTAVEPATMTAATEAKSGNGSTDSALEGVVVETGDLDKGLDDLKSKIGVDCADTPGFLDEMSGRDPVDPDWMGTCTDWKDRPCDQAFEKYHYTQAGEDEILANCKLSCGVCTPGNMTAGKPPEDILGHWWQPTDFVSDRCVHADTEYHHAVRKDALGMTPMNCFAACSMQRGMRYFGIANGDTCWCADHIKASETNFESCNRPCPGDESQTCGGTGAISSVSVMFDCQGNTAEQDADIAAEKRQKILSSYTSLAGQTCGQADDNQVQINGAPTQVGSVEECMMECMGGKGAVSCHGFTFDKVLSKCTFHYDVFSGG
jgi:antitoxin component of RelBE/YafQ-DinJ toxin-antitoxin module